MGSRRFGRHLGCVAALALAAGAAQATVVVYTSEAAFLAAVTGAATDSFDDLVAGAALPATLTRDAGGITYTVATGSALFGAGSAADGWLSTDRAADTITFSGFGTGIGAIGAELFGSRIDGAFQRFTSVVVSVTDAGGTTTTTLARTNPDSFIGFVSDSRISSFSVTANQGLLRARWPTVDDLTLANPVPEAGTAAMLLAGLGVVALVAQAARRRR